MSSLKLLHSGGNGVIISAPSSNPASNRTITVPGNADGEMLTTTNPKTGNILQVVQTFKTDAYSESVGAHNASGVAMSVNITPTSASNKLFIKAIAHISSSNSENIVGFNFSKDGTEQVLNSASVGSRVKCTATSGNERTYYISPCYAEYLVTAGGTSQQTWGVMMRSGSGSTQTIKLNRGSADSDDAGTLIPISSITIFEVAA